MNGWLRPALVIARKDLTVELRTKEILTAIGLFALVVVVSASFAFPTLGRNREAVGAGVLWMAILFAALLGIGRSFALEREESCIWELVGAPVPRESVFLGKLLANLGFTALAEAAIVPVFLVLLQLEPGGGWLLLALSVPLGTLALVTVGTLLAAMAVNTRAREAILPMLAIPIAVPAMIASVQATRNALEGRAVGAAGPWLVLLAVYSVLFLIVSVTTFSYLVEE